MRSGSKDNAVGLILNGALLFIAAFSMLSSYYPPMASWIFLGSCFFALLALGIAAKVAFNERDLQVEESAETESEHSEKIQRRPQTRLDLAKALSSLKESGHGDAYWQIVSQIALEQSPTKSFDSAEGFSITLNIINVYTASRALPTNRPGETDKVDYILRPDLVASGFPQSEGD